MLSDKSSILDNSVSRVVRVLRLLAEEPSAYGVSEVSRKLNTSKGTTYRILASMEALGWTIQDKKRGKYRLGPEAINVGLALVSDLINIDQVSISYIYELRDATTESSALSVRVGLDYVFTQQVLSEHELRPHITLGKRYPLWYGACGKAILAYLDPKEITAASNKFETQPYQFPDPSAVRKPFPTEAELAEIRARGLAVSLTDWVGGLGALASPVFGFANEILGAVTIAVPLYRLNAEAIERYGLVVSDVAKRISDRLKNVKSGN